MSAIENRGIFELFKASAGRLLDQEIILNISLICAVKDLNFKPGLGWQNINDHIDQALKPARLDKHGDVKEILKKAFNNAVEAQDHLKNTLLDEYNTRSKSGLVFYDQKAFQSMIPDIFKNAKVKKAVGQSFEQELFKFQFRPWNDPIRPEEVREFWESFALANRVSMKKTLRVREGLVEAYDALRPSIKN